MELAHLVRAVKRAKDVLKVLARFAVIGAALFGARRLVAGNDPERLPLVVEVDASSGEADVARAVDEAILLRVAIDAGWARSDAVVRERIRKSLEAVEDVSDPERTIARGLAMEIPSRDPVARARLVSVARATLEAPADEVPVPDADVQRWLEDHPGALDLPARVTFDAIFLSRARRGDRLAQDARGAAAMLTANPEAVVASDPMPVSFRGSIDVSRLDALVGDGFGASVLAAPKGAWSAPIATPFGVYLVRVRDVEPPRQPTSSEARGHVTASIRQREREVAFGRRMGELRARYDVAIERRP